MDQDVKKLISEAFNELYNELMSEDAAELASNLSPADLELANSMINQAKSRGGSINFNSSQYVNPITKKLTNYNAGAENAFNYAIDSLVDYYKETGDAKAKEALQVAFLPVKGNRVFNSAAGKWAGKRGEIEDAVTSAHEQTLLNNFDGLVNSYTTGSGKFGALVNTSLKNAVSNWFTQGYMGKGLSGGKNDVVGGGYTKSMDDPIGDSEKTFRDTLAGTELDPSSIERGFLDREEVVDRGNKILSVINGWLKNNVSNSQYIAFRELTKGNTPKEVAEDFPQIFQDNKAVSRNFAQLMSREENEIGDDGQKTGNMVKTVDVLSELISNAFGIDFSMLNIIPKNLRQQISMDPSFSGGGTRTKVATPEIKAAQQELNDTFRALGSNILKAIGVSGPNDYNSQIKIDSIVDKLNSMDKTQEASDIESAWYDKKEAEKASSEFDKKMSFVDDVEDTKDNFGGMFEGFNMDALMERVLLRLSK